MAASTIDELNIRIVSDAQSAVDAIDSLVKALERLRDSGVSRSINTLSAGFKKLGAIDLSQIATGVSGLASALNSIQNVSGLSTSFSSLARATDRLAAAKIPTDFANNLRTTMAAFNGLQVNPELANTLSMFAKAIRDLGGKRVATSAKNLPALARGIDRLFKTLARAPTINMATLQAIATVAQLQPASMKAAAGVGKLGEQTKKTTTATKEFSTAARHGALNTHSLSTRLAFAIGKYRQIYFIVRRLVRFFGKMVESAMDYVETLNYFSAAFEQVASRSGEIFGDAGQEAGQAFTNRFAAEAEKLTEKMSGYTVTASGMVENTMGTTLGMNPATMMNYQAVFAQMASSMGVSSDMAVDLSRALTEIGADLASVRNMDFEQTWKNLQSGLVGMSRAVDKYGLNIRNVNLQQKLMELGIDANIQEMNQQDKALLRTIIILENSQYAWGDLADTLQQPANQMRMLKSGVANLGRTIGNVLLPIVSAALPYINAFVVALQKMFETLVKLLNLDFDWGSVMNQAAIDSDWADYLEESEDGFTAAAQAAEEYKNQLLGFDEINKLGNESSDSGSDAAGSNPLITGALEEALRGALDRYQAVWDRAYEGVNSRVNDLAQNIIDWFGRIKQAAQPTLDALKRLWDEVLVPLAGWKWGVLSDFYNDFLKPVALWVVGEGIPRLVDLLIRLYNDIDWDRFREAFDKLWKALAPLVTATFDGFIAFFEAIEPIASLAFEGAIKFVNDLGDFLNAIDPELLKLLGEVLAAAAGIRFVGRLFGIGSLASLFGLTGKGGLGAGAGGGSFLTKALLFGGKALMASLGADIVSEVVQSALTEGGTKQNSGGKLWAEWGVNIGANVAAGAAIGSKGGWVGALVGALAGLTKSLATFEDSRGEGFDDKLRIAGGMAVNAVKVVGAALHGQSLEEYEKQLAEAERKAEMEQARRDRERALRTYGRRKELNTNVWDMLARDTVVSVDIFGNRERAAVEQQDTNVRLLRQKDMRQYGTQVVGAWNTVANDVETALRNRFPGIVSLFEGHRKETEAKAAETGRTVKDAYVNSISTVGTEIGNKLREAENIIRKASQALTGESKTSAANAKKGFTDTFGTLGTEIQKTVSGLNSTIGNILSYQNVKTSIGGVIKAFTDTFREASNAAVTQYNIMASNMNHSATMNGTNVMRMTAVPLAYANGGFPEDGLFWANSRELVGGFTNGRTAVANNTQIIEGIEGGVARGMMAALMSSGTVSGGTNGQPIQVTINVDSETLYRTTLRGQDKYNSRYHINVR